MPFGKSIWLGSPGHRHLRALAETGEEHLHLHAGCVLRLVENDVRVGQRASAHEGERRDLNDARFKIALDLLGRQHVVEGVVERAQIGIDLLAHVAGQEAETLAGFDGRTRKDDALDHTALETMSGLGDGDVGLAGAGRADSEDEIGLIQRTNVGALHRRARLDDAAARGDLRLPVAGDALLACMPNETVEVAGADRLAGRRTLVQLLEHAARNLTGGFRPIQRDDVAVRVRLDAEAIFDQRKMTVVFTE